MTKPDNEAAQSGVSRRLLKEVEEANRPHHPENTPTAHEGPVDKSRPDYPSSGALSEEGHRPVLERSRKVR